MKVLYIVVILLFPIQYTICQIPCKCDFEQRNNLFYYADTVYSGEYRCYYNSEILKEIGYVSKGKLDSISQYYNKNGEIVEMNWRHDNQLIKRRLFTYNPTGKIITTIDVDNKEHGLCERYFPNGNIKERQFFDHGIPFGTWTTWDFKGRITMETDFSGEYTIREIHDYRFGKHKILVQHFDKDTNKVVFKELIKE